MTRRRLESVTVFRIYSGFIFLSALATDVLMSETGYFDVSLLVSSLLFERADARILACSSTEKFFQVNFGSTISLYISRISLCDMTPGLVKLKVPDSLARAMFTKTGIISSSTVMEFGTEQTFSYLQILVMKFREWWYPVMGIRIRRFRTSESNWFMRRSVKPFTVEYEEPQKFGGLSSVKPR